MKYAPETIAALTAEFDRATELAADHTGTARQIVHSEGAITPVAIEHLNIAAIAAGAALQIAQNIYASESVEFEFGIRPDESVDDSAYNTD